ncbi:MAG: PAS domain-containing protein [Alphaproteobacteria bacterium]|nr:PAS domain-containing protein [Alphaproteobacteria bacterium]
MSLSANSFDTTTFQYAPLIDPAKYNHELIRGLAGWWRDQAAAQASDDLPDWNKVDKLSLMKWMGWLMVYELVGDGDKVVDARFRLVGTRIVDMAGYDLTGMLLSERSYSMTPEIVIGNLNRIAEHGQPAVQNNRIRTLGDYAELSDRLWLPFSGEDGNVGTIMIYLANVNVLVDRFDSARLQ